MKHARIVALLLPLFGIRVSGQTRIDLRTQGRNVDFSASETTKPSKTGATLPVTCSVGETFFKVDAPAGQNLFACTAADVWTLISSPVSSVFGRTGTVSAQSGDYLFSQIGGVAQVSQGGTGTSTPEGARSNLGVAALSHTHALSDLSAISGKHGAGSLLQAFGGGTVNANDCAQFDASGNLVSAGSACGVAGFTAGEGIAIAGQNIATDDAVIPFYSVGSGAPSIPCTAGRDFYTDTASGTLYLCRTTDSWQAVSGGSGGLAEPGANGMVVRTAPGTTAARTLTGATGRITVNNGDGVSGDPIFDVGSNIVDKTQAAVYTAGAKQTFQASGSTAGANIGAAALPSTPATGDLAVDSADSNKLKWYDGSAWQAAGGGAGGGAPTDAQYLTLATDSTLSAERVLTPGTWMSQADGGAGGPLTYNFLPNPRAWFYLHEEFCGGSTASGSRGELSWAGTTGTYSKPTGELNHPCLLRADTGGTVNTLVSGFLSSSGSIPQFVSMNAATWRMYWIARVNQGTQVKTRLGLSANASGDPAPDGIWFENTTGESAANWACVTRASSTETSTDTGATLDTGFHTFEIRADGSQMIFYIDGLQKCSHNTNLPGAALLPFYQIKNSEASSKTLDLDAWQLQVSLSR